VICLRVISLRGISLCVICLRGISLRVISLCVISLHGINPCLIDPDCVSAVPVSLAPGSRHTAVGRPAIKVTRAVGIGSDRAGSGVVLGPGVGVSAWHVSATRVVHPRPARSPASRTRISPGRPSTPNPARTEPGQLTQTYPSSTLLAIRLSLSPIPPRALAANAAK
jgi:hypothetical protein